MSVHVSRVPHDAGPRKLSDGAFAWLVGLGMLCALIAALGLAYYAGITSLETASLWGPS